MSEDIFNLGKSGKNTIDKKDWANQLQKIQVSKQDLNKLVMNFFLVEGYKEAAEKLREESGTPISDYDLNLMQPRIEVRQLILQGKIDQAIEKVNSINKDIFKKNSQIMFELKLQKLIEMIKEGEVDDGIKYA